MNSSSRRTRFSASIQIILLFGYAAYIGEAMMPHSNNHDKEHDFPKDSEMSASSHRAGDHMRTELRQDEASRQRQKTVLANTGRINVKFLCNSRRIMSMKKNGTLISHQKTPSPFKILVNSTQTSPGDVVNVTIKSTGKEAFRGFFLQMLYLPSYTEHRAFLPQSRFLPTEQTTVTSCVNAEDTILHANESLKETISFLWKAPSNISGHLQISGSILEDEDTYWENVHSEPISVNKDHWQKDKQQNAVQTTLVDMLNNNQAETTPPSHVTINPISTENSIPYDVYSGKTAVNTVSYRTTAPIKKTATGTDQGVITWNSVPQKTSKTDEPFDNELSREGIHFIGDGSGNTVADRTFYQGLQTVNTSQMTDSVGPLGKFVTPPESSEALGSAVKSIVGVAEGGGLGTVFKVATTLVRLQRVVGKHKSPQVSKMTGYNVKKSGGIPVASLSGIGAQKSLMDMYSNPHALRESQLFQQQVASQNALLPQTNPFLAQYLGLQSLQNPQLGLQTPELGLQSPLFALQNQLGLPNSLLNTQTPNGLQTYQFGIQTPQLGLQEQTNPLFGQSQFEMVGLQLGNMPQQNQFGQFIPGQGMVSTGQQLNIGVGDSNILYDHGLNGLREGVDSLGGAGLSDGAGGLGGMVSGLMPGGRGTGGLGNLLRSISPDQLNSVTNFLSGPDGDVLKKSVFELLNGENGGAIKSAVNGMLAGDMSAMGNLQSMLSGSAGDSIRNAVTNSLKP
ncbi:hypothetical protein ACJMK2_008340 [Sinanodonta woodiana]|uniref:Reelin domain-containing protein n=1 Tax=Sinanodonta woodiana TaxID=1069815 RepID=A0ABD3VLA5_SINWO